MAALRNCLVPALLSIAIPIFGSVAYAQQTYDVVIMGDTQFFRTTDPKLPVNTRNAVSLASNHLQVMAINDFASQVGSNYVGTIINGDLTEFGRNDGDYNQLLEFRNYYNESNLPKGEFWPGLGNHDYENNVNDSHENNAALRMVQYLMVDTIKRLSSKHGIVASDVTSRNENGAFVVEGSLSYSWDIGKDYRFIQSNNYPDYKVSFNGWHWENPFWPTSRDITRRYVAIPSSIANGWLMKQLDTAVSDGKKVVLNMHHPNSTPKGVPNKGEWDKLDTLMKNYSNIEAVFVGHFHENLGQCDGGFGDTIGHNVPVFYSGTPIYATMLVAKLGGVNGLEVDRYSTAQGSARKLGTAFGTCLRW
ncbi:MAG: hypothetical protein RIB30_19355 [Thalassospira sp.]|uniref:metallophosphoesterase n=1 Tax=Thalassospira sp. TaxID=1912094 RepID=UPI0032EDD57F